MNLTRHFLNRCQYRGLIIVRGNEVEATQCAEAAGHTTGPTPTPCKAFGRVLKDAKDPRTQLEGTSA